MIGSGPNGLSAALVCAKAGLRVTVYEAEDTIGGGARTASLTLPGFLHDRYSSIYPLGIASPFFRALPIEAHGVVWLHARYPLAHPLDDGDAVVVDRSVRHTAEMLDEDAHAYERLMSALAQDWEPLVQDVLAPPHFPRRPLLMAGFGLAAAQPATWLAARFTTGRARALIAGLAAHSGAPLDAPLPRHSHCYSAPSHMASGGRWHVEERNRFPMHSHHAFTHEGLKFASAGVSTRLRNCLPRRSRSVTSRPNSSPASPATACRRGPRAG